MSEIEQMAEAEDVARDMFGSDVAIAWRLDRHDGPELWMEIICPAEMSVGAARSRMRQFDEGYWLAVVNRRSFAVTHTFAAKSYARLVEDVSPLGHGTPVPEETTLPSGDARVAGL